MDLGRRTYPLRGKLNFAFQPEAPLMSSRLWFWDLLFSGADPRVLPLLPGRTTKWKPSLSFHVDRRAHPGHGPITVHCLTKSSCGMKTMEGDDLRYRWQKKKKIQVTRWWTPRGKEYCVWHCCYSSFNSPFQNEKFCFYLCTKFIMEPWVITCKFPYPVLKALHTAGPKFFPTKRLNPLLLDTSILTEWLQNMLGTFLSSCLLLLVPPTRIPS